MATKKVKKVAEATSKRISVNTLEEIIKNTYVGSEVFQWNGIDVEVTKTLSLEDMMDFVDSVTKCCFHGESHMFMPEIRDFAIRMNVMEKYANFTLPRNTKLKYDFVMCADAVDRILEHINMAQYEQILRAIDEKIQNQAAANVEMVNKRLNDLVTEFNNMYEALNRTFSGISSEDIQNIAKSLANHMPNEQEIVDAYINASKRAE